MMHNLKISVSKAPRADNLLSCRTVNIRERLLRFLFGEKHKVTILIPGDRVDEVSICGASVGGATND